MRKLCISKDWYLQAPGINGTEKVDLPNDYSITLPRDPRAPGGGHNGFFVGGVGNYTKYFVPEAGKHHILDVDGAYCCAEFVLNNDWLAIHPNGYTPFLLDLTDHLRPGIPNKLEITTNDLQPSTRWYSGAGIYRDVFLWTGGDVRIEPWDCFVTTPSVEQTAASVKVSYVLCADRDASVTVKTQIRDAQGKPVAADTAALSVRKGKNPAEAVLSVKDPQLWDLDDPYLYSLVTVIEENGRVLDDYEMTFGIRTICADAERGFQLNGKPLKLRGGCLHHDHGVLGAACFPAAEARRLRILKDAGFNALRISHNPPSLTLLELCDRMGILIMDEAFDVWNRQKKPQDYHIFFGDWWARDLSYMVLRDRNHPCVISYSIGNEIPERDGNSDGIQWAKKLVSEIRRYDDTRFVTSGIHNPKDRLAATDPPAYTEDFRKRYPPDSWASRTEACMAELDIAGYNYEYTKYEEDHARYPHRVIWGSETHTLHFYDSWQEVKKLNCVIGDFTWVSWDYLGGAGVGRFSWARDGVVPGLSLAGYPWRACRQGDIDLCGFRRPQSYFREAIWLGNTEPRIFTTHPEHYGEGFTGTGWHFWDVHDSWTFDDRYLGQPVKAEVYTDADEIEWYLNGRCLGRTVPVKAVATMDIPYEKGELSVIAYKGGQKCGTSSLHTVGKPAAVLITPETDRLAADNRDLCYLAVAVTDKNGDRIPDDQSELICRVDGGELLGIFSSDTKNEDQYGSDRCHAYEGRALIVLRAAAPGPITVHVQCGQLKPGSVTVTAY